MMVTWWAVASALAVLTHYFAVFTILPEAIALLVLLPDLRRRVALAIGGELDGIVGAIIANEQLSGASIGLATETALDRLSVQAEALAVEGALRGMRLANRDVRLAVTAAEVDTALATLQANQADAGRRVEETFRFARSGLSEYAAATIEIAAARKEMFKTEQIQVEAAAKWTKAFEAFRASPALTGLPNRRDVEFDLHHANLSLVDALLSFWRYRMDFDPAHAKLTVRQREGDMRAAPAGLSFKFEGPNKVSITRPAGFDGGAIYDLEVRLVSCAISSSSSLASSHVKSRIRNF